MLYPIELWVRARDLNHPSGLFIPNGRAFYSEERVADNRSVLPVMGQFDVTGHAVSLAARAASHSRDSISPTMSIIDQSRSVTPASIAGVQRMVW